MNQIILYTCKTFLNIIRFIPVICYISYSLLIPLFEYNNLFCYFTLNICIWVVSNLGILQMVLLWIFCMCVLGVFFFFFQIWSMHFERFPSWLSEQHARQETWVGKSPWRRKWQPTAVFLPGKSYGQRSLVGYSPWGCTKSDMT